MNRVVVSLTSVVVFSAACNSNQTTEQAVPEESVNFETAAQELCNLMCTMRRSRTDGDKEKFRQDRMNLKRFMDAVDELREEDAARSLLEACDCE